MGQNDTSDFLTDQKLSAEIPQLLILIGSSLNVGSPTSASFCL